MGPNTIPTPPRTPDAVAGARAVGVGVWLLVALALTVLSACAPRSGPVASSRSAFDQAARATNSIGASAVDRRATVGASYVAQFDSLWARFDASYPSFEYKGIDWKAQRAIYRARAMRARSQAEFIDLACEMLEPLRDLHIWFVDPRGHVVPTHKSSHVANFDRARWQRALADAGYVERIEGLGEADVAGFGYLFIGTWHAPVDMAALDLAMSRMREAPGLIIDVRTNGGGIDATALAFAQRFTSRAFAASYVQRRNGPEYDNLDLPSARTVAPGGPWQFLLPVVLITGRAGLSATESFVAAMRTLPNVTVIGDTTGGSSGNPATFSLGNGWSHTVPQWIEFGPDKQPIEWRGVAPHVAIPWAPSFYERSRDPLIDAAVGLLAEINGVYRIAPIGDESSSGSTRGLRR